MMKNFKPTNKRVSHFNAFKLKDSDEKKPKLGFLPEETMSYYRQVSSTLENGFEDDDTVIKDDFLDNVYASLQEEAVQVSQNQTVSRILEALFVHSKPSHLNGLFAQMSKELALVCFDRFASHVFQSLIQYLPLMYKASKEEDSQNQSDLQSHIDKLCQFVESHMRDFMTHTYGSHVIRSLLEALAGVTVKEDIVRSRLSRNQSYAHAAPSCPKVLSEDHHTWFQTLKDKIIKLCNYDDHLRDENYCPVLQTVMLILHKVSPPEYQELAKSFLKKICVVEEDVGETGDVFKRIPSIVQNEVGSYLFELLISLSSDTELEQLYRDVFKQKMVYFAIHPIANFVLQRFLSAINDAGMMKEVLDELSQFVEDILAMNHIGVITKLAEACRRTHTGQDKFIEVMMTAFHCHATPERQLKIVPLIASIQTYEIFFQDSEQAASDQGDTLKSSGLLKSVKYHGSLLLQQLLQFHKPIQIVSSFLDLTETELSNLCCDKFGSHVVEMFFQSPSNRAKNKDSFLKKLQGFYVNVACNRTGTRCLEAIWKMVNLKQRVLIAEELLKGQERLEGDQFGRFLFRNFALSKFVGRRSEWEELQGVLSRKRQILKDILEGTGGGKKKKKKEKKWKQDDAPPTEGTPSNVNNDDDASSVTAFIDRKGSRVESATEETIPEVPAKNKRKSVDNDQAPEDRPDSKKRKVKIKSEDTFEQQSGKQDGRKEEKEKQKSKQIPQGTEDKITAKSETNDTRKKKKKKRRSKAASGKELPDSKVGLEKDVMDEEAQNETKDEVVADVNDYDSDEKAVKKEDVIKKKRKKKRKSSAGKTQ